ncbi:hypothetical protein [Desulfosarcina ovata]|uniref:Uncharacterized protein n=1 Tax=Desulfosarcina ovata subsp. ovata TaxID=2752305 RepID=A0A5K8ADV9_9BACT|nr:hypothetical protein [Desulfosarcina ovata]BBO90767.1 hypothetical protein DSCOOX_39470 [Desulfosarcina ovata subsp. ovata]
MTLKSKRFVRCICPRCRKTFTIYMVWTGRGMPRKYCVDCRAIINTYDKSAVLESCDSVLVPAQKRGRNSFEEY